MCKMIPLVLITLLSSNVFISSASAAQTVIPAKRFEMKRGTNISHWLSQVKERPNKKISTQEWFTEKDVVFLKGLGFDHLRFPIEEAIMWDSTGKKIDLSFQILHSALKWCMKSNVKVVVDLHIIRAHHFNELNAITLWKDTLAQQNLCRLWQELSTELKNYPNDMVAYELFNEAVADNNEDLNKLQKRMIAVIRKDEPTRTIIIGSNKWQAADRIPFVRLPENDTNIILSFHFYKPLILTHYKAYWTPAGKYQGLITYPGPVVEEKDLQGLPKDVMDKINEDGTCRVFTIDTLEKFISIAVKFAAEKKLKLYCGEFGCLPSVPKEARLRWYSDLRTIFNRNDIAWANWDHKGDFGLIDYNTGEKNEDLINALLK
jgi:endoglucanase